MAREDDCREDRARERLEADWDADGPTGICSSCGAPCEAEYRDEGIGPYEYWGSRGVHEDWRWVSPCCGADVIDPPEEEDEDDE